MASRSLSDLQFEIAEKAKQFLVLCDQYRLQVLIYNTLRTFDEQARLFRQGRPFSEIQRMAAKLDLDYGRKDLCDVLLGVGAQYGAKVTQAAPGMSAHNYGLAFDGCPMLDGKPIWILQTDKEKWSWDLYGRLIEKADLEWGGSWVGFPDYPHAQQRDFNWRDLIKTV